MCKRFFFITSLIVMFALAIFIDNISIYLSIKSSTWLQECIENAPFSSLFCTNYFYTCFRIILTVPTACIFRWSNLENNLWYIPPIKYIMYPLLKIDFFSILKQCFKIRCLLNLVNFFSRMNFEGRTVITSGLGVYKSWYRIVLFRRIEFPVRQTARRFH